MEDGERREGRKTQGRRRSREGQGEEEEGTILNSNQDREEKD